jgi:IS6 family transposase
MTGDRPALFRERHFADDVIVLCVRWYLRYSLSYRDLAEMMVERHLSVNSSTIWRWVQRYAPELDARIETDKWFLADRRDLCASGGTLDLFI